MPSTLTGLRAGTMMTSSTLRLAHAMWTLLVSDIRGLESPCTYHIGRPEDAFLCAVLTQWSWRLANKQLT